MTNQTSPVDLSRYPRVASFLRAYDDGPGAVLSETTETLVSAVDRAVVREQPFVTAIIDDFLPHELYAAVIDAWADLQFEPVEILGSKYVGSRRAKRLHNWTAESEPESDIPPGPWTELARAARSSQLTHALFARFAQTVENNLTNPSVADAHEPGFVLWANQDDGSDEALGAHVDALHKLFTIVVYLDLNGPTNAESPRQWGTAVYKSAPDEVIPVRFSPNAERVPADVVEFRPNRAFLMPNTAGALHGVVGGQSGVSRRSLMWGYWYRSPNR